MKNFFNWDITPVENFSRTDLSGTNLYEDEKHIYAEVTASEISKKDIQINFEKEILWIKGEAKKERGNVKYFIKCEENFSYRIPIPNKVDDNSPPEATYKDGILKIKFNKTLSTKSHQIEIKDE